MGVAQRVVSGQAARVAYLGRSVHHNVNGFGLRSGLRIAWLERRPVRTIETRVPGGPPLAARVGRGQTDVNTMLHVWRDVCYEIDELPEPSWIVDAGANVGYATRWFAERYPAATVIAIEPDEGNLELLRRNTEGLTNVHAIHGALAAEVGVAEVVDVGQGPWAFRVGAAVGQGGGRVIATVDCVSMDSLMTRFGIDRLGLLKIDIEGGELEVFREASPWIDRVDAIAVELHDRFRPGCTRAYIDATVGFAREFVRGENSFAVRVTEDV